jgi:type IV pilus assembly protein PilV
MAVKNFSHFFQYGTGMIELLVTLIILSVGLIGLTNLQAKLQLAQIEVYQRSQALMLLHDMASRININRNKAVDYVTANPLGVGMNCPTPLLNATQQQLDFAEWCNALQGAGEILGASKVGALVGGRGCIEALGSNSYLVTVAWQGMSPISAPPASISCGSGMYDGVGDSPCVVDRCRLTVNTVVEIGNLAGL